MAGIAAPASAYVLSQLYRSFMAVLTPALTLGVTKAQLLLPRARSSSPSRSPGLQ
ncbi:hypothetical protein [Aminobacter sp. HY435]|uniref:hypothetical protein n=1 Tax=Aminobacter sp. HY435 TaxID=2970917 RepID=UPI0022B9861D|nr:hypothetical protein [Aminobacter sp. HY435]